MNMEKQMWVSGTDITDHLIVDVVDNSAGDWHWSGAPQVKQLISIVVDNYHPENDEAWDVDEWDDGKAHVFALPNRSSWQDAYRLARTLAKHGKARVTAPGGIVFDVTLPSITFIGGL